MGEKKDEGYVLKAPLLKGLLKATIASGTGVRVSKFLLLK